MQTTDETIETTRLPFSVHDEESAAWAADKILSARERLARVTAACAEMIAEAGREVVDLESLFLPQLEAWARQNPPRKGRTIRLPVGKLSFRTVPGGPRVTDEAAALEWARQYLPAAVQVREKVLATPIKEYVEQTGEAVPGVEMVESRETFDVKGA